MFDLPKSLFVVDCAFFIGKTRKTARQIGTIRKKRAPFCLRKVTAFARKGRSVESGEIG
ncbi:MAG: hypothetical protein KH054_00060 [Firmicutes bacterium]|nr:hypothetical protein [Bacillota bacterium]